MGTPACLNSFRIGDLGDQRLQFVRRGIDRNFGAEWLPFKALRTVNRPIPAARLVNGIAAIAAATSVSLIDFFRGWPSKPRVHAGLILIIENNIMNFSVAS